MKKILITLLIALLLPLGLVSAQQEPDATTTDDPILYYDDGSDYEYEYDYDYASDSWEDISDQVSIEEDAIDIVDTAAIAGLMAFLAAYIVTILVVSIGTYILSSLALMKIGNELGYKNSWFAWVPILNSVMFFQLGDQSPWLILLALIPGLGVVVLIIFSVIAGIKLLEKRGYEAVYLLLAFVPLGAYILTYLVAWKPKVVTQVQPNTQTPTM